MTKKRQNRFKLPVKTSNKISLLVIGLITLAIFVAGYLNSKTLNVQRGDAYQGEPCSSSQLGQTRCEVNSKGSLTGNMEECVGTMWQVYSCGGRGCTNGACVVATPTPYAGMNCNNAAGRCVPSTSICNTTSTQSDCAPGQKCVAETASCVTPTPAPVSGDDGCFLAGTQVATSTGTRNIEDLEVGSQVLSFDASRDNKVNSSEVSNLYKVTRDHYYKITTKGNTVSVTAEHPFYRGGGSYTNAEDLNVGDEVYLLDDNYMTANTVTAVEKVNDQVEAYNLTVDSDHTFFANNFAVHNKGPESGTAPTLDAQCIKNYSSLYSPGMGGYISTSTSGATCNSGDVYLGSVNNSYCTAWYITNVWCRTWSPVTERGHCCVRPNAYNQAQVAQDCGGGASYIVNYNVNNIITECKEITSTPTCKAEKNSNCVRRWQEGVLARCDAKYPGYSKSQDPYSSSKPCDIMTQTLGSYSMSKGSCCPSGY